MEIFSNQWRSHGFSMGRGEMKGVWGAELPALGDFCNISKK